MKKRFVVTLALLTVVCLLTGCARTGVGRDNESYPTLPPAEAVMTAPDGDLLDYQGTAAVYLPTLDGRRLSVRYGDTVLSAGSTNARTVLELLLRQGRDDVTDAAGGNVRMNLYSPQAVAVAGGICTVSLSSSALALSPRELYTVALCATSTLCALDDITAVNLLVADMAPGMDIAGNLPLGTLTTRPGTQTDVLWDAFDAKRTPLGEDPSATSLTATVTLYFPLADGAGVYPETRTLTFPGQTPQQLAAGLITALSAGSQYNTGAAVMPDIGALLAEAPLASDMLEGGRLITLRFRPETRDMLNRLGISLDSFVSSLLLTVTTFVPSVSAMRIELDGAPLESLGQVTFRSGLIRRSDLADRVRSVTAVCMREGSGLVYVDRSVPAGTIHDPRTLLLCMMQGTTPAEEADGITAVLPANLNDNDLLGFSLQDGTLAVNLSDRFRSAIIRWGKQDERLLCYSLVNTLCAATGARRVAFFFEGRTEETLAGTIYWGGTFLPTDTVME